MDSGPDDVSREYDSSTNAGADADSSGCAASALLEAANLAYFRATVDGTILETNDELSALTGYQQADLVGHPFARLVADGTTISSLLDDRSPGEPVSTSVPIRTEPGDVVDCQLHVDRHAASDGEDPAVEGLLERASVEPGSNALQPAYGRTFEALADALPDGIIVLDTDSNVQYANPAVEDILGFSPDDLVGSSKVNIIPPRLQERHLTALQRYLETGERNLNWSYIEFPGQHRDGHEIPLGVSLNEFFYDGDRYFVGLFRDISPRKQAERTLTAKVVQLESVAYLGQRALDHSPIEELLGNATELIDAALDTDYCAVFEDVSGPTPPDSVADRELIVRAETGFDDVLVDDETVSVAGTDSIGGRTLMATQPIVITDLETDPRFSGSSLLADAGARSGIAITIGPSSEPWGLLCAFETECREFADHDVDFLQSVGTILTTAIERQRYEERLTETVDDLTASNERLEQFAYAASHDLQEPLRMVSSYLQLVESRYAEALDEDGLEFIHYAVDGADRMRAMIDGLLEYSRVDSQGESFEAVDLDAVFDDVLTDLQVMIEDSNAEITADSLPTVRGDTRQLRQLFQNLLSNAIEYSGDAPPQVHVSAERNGTTWELSVQDEGIGIDPEDSDRVFAVFQRLHSREEYPGAGIGLAICRRIVERHGGRIWVDSEPDSGATFRFTIPAEGAANRFDTST